MPLGRTNGALNQIPVERGVKGLLCTTSVVLKSGARVLVILRAMPP